MIESVTQRMISGSEAITALVDSESAANASRLSLLVESGVVFSAFESVSSQISSNLTDTLRALRAASIGSNLPSHCMNSDRPNNLATTIGHLLQ